MQKATQSAGGIILNPLNEVVVVSQRGDSWSLPKGHIDSGEQPQQAAEREIAEETGITQLAFIRELGSYERYRIGKDGEGEDTNELKRIHIFLYKTLQQTLAPIDTDNPEAKWVPIAEVAGLLTHPKDKEFFESVKGGLK